MMRRRIFLGALLGSPPASTWARRQERPAAQLRDQANRELRRLVDGAAERGDSAGGALAVFHRGETVFHDGFGSSDLAARRRFTVDDLCYIASLAKPVFATLFVILDDRGTVRLDDLVEKWLPEFRGIRVRGQDEPARPLRVWHVICQRSGLPGNQDPGAIGPYLVAHPGEAPRPRKGPADRRFFGQPAQLSEVVAGWARGGLFAQPGTFSWGSSGSLAAARIAEVATGKRFESVLKDLVLDPLGMTRTTYYPSSTDLDRLPRFYARTSAVLEPDRAGLPVILPNGLVNPGGGLYSTATDMGRFFRMHNRRGLLDDGSRLVSEKALARMYRLPPELANEAAPAVRYGRSGEEGPYGLGWNFAPDGSWIRHLGASGVLGWVDLRVPCAGVYLSHTPWEGAKGLADQLIAQVRASFS